MKKDSLIAYVLVIKDLDDAAKNCSYIPYLHEGSGGSPLRFVFVMDKLAEAMHGDVAVTDGIVLVDRHGNISVKFEL